MMAKVMSAGYYPELLGMLKNILEDISANVIKEGQPIIIMENYNWYKESISLMAKQINLCDSCLLLLENGMEQEAYLLARSQFNNLLWIKYICEDTGDNHVKEYFYQPHISQIYTSRSLKKMLENFEGTLDERFDKSEMLTILDKRIEENEKVLHEENMESKPKRISELAQQDGMLFGMYITLYNEGSKFEHSDISKTRKYRKPIIDGYTEDQVFTIDMGISNKEDWLMVYRYSLYDLFFSFECIYNRITKREDHLFLDTAVSKAPYSKESFGKILLKFNSCISALEAAEQKNIE